MNQLRPTHNSAAARCGYLPEIQTKLLDLQVRVREDVVTGVVQLHRDLLALQRMVTAQLEAQGAY